MKDIVSTLEKKDLPELNKFDWQDPLLLDSKLSDSERLLVKSVREFAEKKLLPRVEKAFQTEEVDRDIIRSMGEMGLLGSTIPELTFTVNRIYPFKKCVGPLSRGSTTGRLESG